MEDGIEELVIGYLGGLPKLCERTPLLGQVSIEGFAPRDVVDDLQDVEGGSIGFPDYNEVQLFGDNGVRRDSGARSGVQRETSNRH